MKCNNILVILFIKLHIMFASQEAKLNINLVWLVVRHFFALISHP